MQWIQDTFNSLTGDTSATSSTPSAISLQTSGVLSKEQLLEFFRAGEEVLSSEATRRKLKDAKLLKQDVDDVIAQLQKQIFEQHGVQGDFGIEFLGRVSSVYKDDDEVMAALLKEEDALDEAEMPEADYQQKRRLLDIAKAHAAQLMSKLDELPAEKRQAFLQDQMLKADQLRSSVVGRGEASEASSQGAGMTEAERLRFFENLQRNA